LAQEKIGMYAKEWAIDDEALLLVISPT